MRFMSLALVFDFDLRMKVYEGTYNRSLLVDARKMTRSEPNDSISSLSLNYGLRTCVLVDCLTDLKELLY